MKVTLKVRNEGLRDVRQLKILGEDTVGSIPIRWNNVFKALEVRELGNCEELKNVQYA